MTLLLARAVLVVLAAYHLTTGLLALTAPARARRLMRTLYGAELPDAAALDYAVSMLGAQALAIGVLAAVAATDPTRHPAVVGALALLQLVRAVLRAARSRILRDSFGVPTRRNVTMIVVLVLEVAILTVFLA